MSSTWVAEFDNEEDYNHFVARVKEIAPNGECITSPEIKGSPEFSRERGAVVNLNYPVYDFDKSDDTDKEGLPPLKKPAWAVSFDIAIWDNWTKDFVLCIMQEMCKRYSFVEIGCNSADLVSAKELMKWRCFYHEKAMVEYFRELIAEGRKELVDKGVTLETLVKSEKEIAQTEKKFREAAKRFFDGDASDLILV